jgi:predicted cation transporter
VAIPLLLDILRIPVDLFQLYLAITVVVSRFSVLLTTMNNLVLTLVGTCAVTGLLTIRWGRVLRNAILTVVFSAVILVGLRTFFSVAVDNAYHKDKILAGMHLLRTKVPATVHRTPPPETVAAPSQSSLERIRTQGVLRVGICR